MPTINDIEQILSGYDHAKGLKRKVQGDQADIKKLRELVKQLKQGNRTKDAVLTSAMESELIWLFIDAHCEPKSASGNAFEKLAEIIKLPSDMKDYHYKNPAEKKERNLYWIFYTNSILTVENCASIYQKPYMKSLSDAFINLHNVNMLTPENRATLLKAPAHANILADGLKQLSNDNILTPENRAALLLNAGHAVDIAHGLMQLSKDNILTPENRTTVCQGGVHASILAHALDGLHRADFLTPENRALICRYAPHANQIEFGIVFLRNSGILTPENQDIICQHPAHASSLSRAFGHLHRGKILTSENIKDVCANVYNAVEVADALVTLDENKILTPENRATVLRYVYSEDIANVLCQLHRANILTQENRLTICRQETGMKPIKDILHKLQQANLVTQENFDDICLYGPIVGEAILKLSQNNILTPDTRRDILYGYKYPREDRHLDPQFVFKVVDALVILSQDNILTLENRNAILQNVSSSRDIAVVLSQLHHADLLTQENRLLVCRNPKTAWTINSVLDKLQRVGLLTQENFDTIYNDGHVHDLNDRLASLNRSNILTQENFNALHRYANVFTSRPVLEAFARLPLQHQFNQNWFDELIATISARMPDGLDNAIHAVEEILNRLIAPNPARAQGQQLNYAQSVHNVRVEKTVVESAERLKRRYPDAFGKNLDKNIAGANEFLNTGIDEFLVKEFEINSSLLNDTQKAEWRHKAESAKRLLAGILNGDIGHYTIPACNNITLKQTMALVWEAMHDSQLYYSSSVTLHRIKESLITQLYECQRNYNFDENDRENSQSGDLPSCIGGTFNKLIFSLHSAHKDVDVQFSTKELALVKLHKLIEEEIESHAKTLSRTDFLTLLKQLTDDGVQTNLWNKIKGTVVKKLNDEHPDHTRAVIEELGTNYQYIETAKLVSRLKKHERPTEASVSSSNIFEAGRKSANASDDENSPRQTKKKRI